MRALCVLVAGPIVVMIATAAGAALATLVAVRQMPMLRSADAAVAGGVGVLLLEGAYRLTKTVPLDVGLLVNALVSAGVAFGVARLVSRERSAGRVSRGVLAALVVGGVGLLCTTLVFALSGSEAGFVLAPVAGAAAAMVLVVDARPVEVVLGCAATFVLTMTGLALQTLEDGAGVGMLGMMTVWGLAIGILLVALGARLGKLLRPTPRLVPDPPGLPEARIER